MGFVVYHAMTPGPKPRPTSSDRRGSQGQGTEITRNCSSNKHGVPRKIRRLRIAAIDMDPEAPNREANPRGTIPADEGLLAMRRVIRRMYGDSRRRCRQRAKRLACAARLTPGE